MKRILSLIFVTVLSITFAFGLNSIGGGSNFYSTSGLSGQVIPALGASGGNALVYVYNVTSDDRVVAELTAAGYTVTVATDVADFNTRIAAGPWSLVVFFNQNLDISLINFSSVQSYVNTGGSMIFTSWDISNSETWANLFGAHYTGNSNMSSVTFIDPILSAGLTNPITISNESWGIWSMGLSAYGSGSEVLARFSNGDAAIIRANGGRTIMLGYLSGTPSPADRGVLFGNVIEAVGANPVPVSMWVMISAFVLIALAVAFRFRRRIF